MFEADEELRHLKSSLHAAEVNHDRHKQVVERVLRKEHLKQAEQAGADMMEYERRAYLEKALTVKIKKSQETGNVKAINQQQIIMKEKNKMKSKIEAEKERLQVQEVVKRIAAEDA